MGNIITIKHGNGAPANKLVPYELGFDISGKKLYIGVPITQQEEDGIIPITTPIEEMIEQSDTPGKMIYFGNNKLYASNLFIIPGQNFGPSLPESGQEGQVFFVVGE